MEESENSQWNIYQEFSFPILKTGAAVYTSPVDIANVIGESFASVSSPDSYSPKFQRIKSRTERTPIRFHDRRALPYNCEFQMYELKRALQQANNTTPGPDGISYNMLRHLSPDSLVNILCLTESGLSIRTLPFGGKLL